MQGIPSMSCLRAIIRFTLPTKEKSAALKGLPKCANLRMTPLEYGTLPTRCSGDTPMNCTLTDVASYFVTCRCFVPTRPLHPSWLTTSSFFSSWLTTENITKRAALGWDQRPTQDKEKREPRINSFPHNRRVYANITDSPFLISQHKKRRDHGYFRTAQGRTQGEI